MFFQIKKNNKEKNNSKSFNKIYKKLRYCMNLKKKIKKNKKEYIWLNLIIFAFPIAIYFLFQHLGTCVDYFIVGESKITPNVRQTISYMKQTQKFLQSIGIALGSAGVVLVAREYKRNEKIIAQQYASVSFIIALSISFLFFIFLYFGVFLPYPFCNIFLNKSYYSDGGLQYYFITLISFIFITINTLYMSLERAKGKKKELILLNLIIISSRIFFSYLYKIIYGIKNVSVVHLAYANLWSHLIISLISFYSMFLDSKNEFKIKFKKTIFSKEIIKKIIKLSFTIIVGKTTYDYGKKIILDMANSFYGKDSVIMITVGYVALVNGIFYSISQSFEEAQTLMISQSIASKEKKKTLIIFKNVVFITSIIGIIGVLTNKFIGNNLLKIIQKGKNLNLEEKKGFEIGIFWEQTSLFTSILSSLMISFIVAYTKKAKIVLLMNIIRIISRIIILWILYKIKILSISSYNQFGLSIFLSNSIVLIITFFLFFLFLKKEKISN
ncbi:MATE family efflux transporter [Candidatus Phytoplasma sacchari]|nr:sodium transporter [Candidatus Phytoplasma sacchari]KAB8122702.1 sodium transporter [Candidatus Phytoplasma sacchari]